MSKKIELCAFYPARLVLNTPISKDCCYYLEICNSPDKWINLEIKDIKKIVSKLQDVINTDREYQTYLKLKEKFEL